jgi:hypothetical protein
LDASEHGASPITDIWLDIIICKQKASKGGIPSLLLTPVYDKRTTVTKEGMGFSIKSVVQVAS